MKANQLMLPVGGEVGELGLSISQAFMPREIKSKDAVVGTAFTLKTRKDIGLALGLTGKANKEALDDAILERRDAAFAHIKGEFAKLNGGWTLQKLANRELSSGERQITVVVREVIRQRGPSDESISQALGISVEEVQAMRARQQKALEATEVETVQTELEAPTPEAPAPAPEAPKVRVVARKAKTA